MNWNARRKAKDMVETLENKDDKGAEEDQRQGTARKIQGRKEEQGTSSTGTGIGTNSRIDRNPQTAVMNWKEGVVEDPSKKEVQEVRKEAARKLEQQRNRKVGVTRVEEHRLKITDIINNFNTLGKEEVKGRNMVKQLPRNTQMVEVEEEQRNKELLSKVTNGRKRKQVEEEIPGAEILERKHMRTPKSETSERDKTIRKYFTINTSSFVTKERPVRVQERGGEPEHLDGEGGQFSARRKPRNTGLSK